MTEVYVTCRLLPSHEANRLYKENKLKFIKGSLPLNSPRAVLAENIVVETPDGARWRGAWKTEWGFFDLKEA